jgi:hypothetical protein
MLILALIFQSYSKPFNFYYFPSAALETKQTFLRPFPIRPVRQSTEPAKQVQKRGREPRQNFDEPSTGEIALYIFHFKLLRFNKIDVTSGTNFSKQENPSAEFSTLDKGVSMKRAVVEE